MTPHPNLWPMMRGAVAAAAREHWHALRLIAPEPDPRTVAAESVATTAAALIQQPSLWMLAELAHLIHDEPAKARRIMTREQLAPVHIAQLGRQLDALDRSARAWTTLAYPSRAA